jgi:phospho-N-acetylmuramoyl-pentapeptide-transferase
MGMVNFIPVVIIVTAVSNGANLTDGIDGFVAGTSAYLCWQEFSFPSGFLESST